ncbi:MAG: laccase domain-containing protein, partial [Edaphobacter sp.]
MAVGNKGLRAGIVQVAEWEPYLWLRHGFSTREGGVSSIYGKDLLNLGWTKDDDPALVAENRRRFLQAVCGDLEGNGQQQAVTVKQVHSNQVRVVRMEDGVQEGRLQTADGKAVMEGDG